MLRLASLRQPHLLPLNTLNPLNSSTNVQIRSKHVYRTRKQGHHPGRARTRETTPFDISPLLLDLDAEDCPYVRPHDEKIKAAKGPRWSERQQRMSVAKFHVREFEKAAKICDKRFDTLKKERFGAWRLSDYDVLSFVLNPHHKEIPGQLEEKNKPRQDKIIPQDWAELIEKPFILEWNGIPKHMQTRPTKLIPYILRRYHIIRDLYSGPGNSESLQASLKAARKTKDFVKRFITCERIIEGALQTSDTKLVSECGDLLGALCDKLVNYIPPGRLLSSLNNVVINLESRGLPISPMLARCAYGASYKCYSLPMLQKYMGMVDEKDRDAIVPLTDVLHTFHQNMTPLYFPERDRTHELVSIYGLLTGRPLGEDSTHASFYDYIPYCDEKQFMEYIACLARLGAFRTMWYIWHEIPELFNRKFIYRIALKKPFPSELFRHSAFELAIKNVAHINWRLLDLVRAPGFTRVAAERDENCELELQTIMASANLLIVNESEPWEEERVFRDLNISYEKIEEIFESPLQESMSRLQSYLLEALGLNPKESLEVRGENPTQDQ